MKPPGVKQKAPPTLRSAGQVGACTPAPLNPGHPVCHAATSWAWSALWDFSKFAWLINMPGQMQAPGLGHGEQNLNPKLSSTGTRAGRDFDDPRTKPGSSPAGHAH